MISRTLVDSAQREINLTNAVIGWWRGRSMAATAKWDQADVRDSKARWCIKNAGPISRISNTRDKAPLDATRTPKPG